MVGVIVHRVTHGRKRHSEEYPAEEISCPRIVKALL